MDGALKTAAHECRGAAVSRQHDITTAVYVLCEMPPAERHRAVAALWQRTSHLLVIIEPGTPAGSATVRTARQQVSPSNVTDALLQAGLCSRAAAGLAFTCSLRPCQLLRQCTVSTRALAGLTALCRRATCHVLASCKHGHADSGCRGGGSSACGGALPA